jgi:predicted kinase
MEKQKERKLYLMVGCAASGKSTFLKNHSFEGTTEIISRDKIRFSLIKDNEPYFSKEKEVWREFVKRAKESLKTNDNTILDATHINEASRFKILTALAPALKDVYTCAIVLPRPLETLLEQNSKRSGRAYVPEDVIKNMYENFTIPSSEEGFDEIIVVERKETKR